MLHNQKPRDVPTTLMRFWWGELRLAAILANPAPGASARELAALEALLEDRRLLEGTVMMEEARQLFARKRLPQPYQPNRVVDLTQHNAYLAFLEFLATAYPEHEFVNENNYLADVVCVPKRSNEYKLYTHVVYQGYK